MEKEGGSDLGVSVFAAETSLGTAYGGGVCALSRVLSWRLLFQAKETALPRYRKVGESEEAV